MKTTLNIILLLSFLLVRPLCAKTIHRSFVGGYPAEAAHALSAKKAPPPQPAALADVPLAPGLTFSCALTLDRLPVGLTTLFSRPEQYMLRFDRLSESDKGSLNFFVRLDGGWEGRAAITRTFEAGQSVSVSGRWTGQKLVLKVNGYEVSVPRWGRPASTTQPLRTHRFAGTLADLVVSVDPTPCVTVGNLRTRELLPQVGEAITVLCDVVNSGRPLDDCRIVAQATMGETVTPSERTLGTLATGVRLTHEWALPKTSNGLVHVRFDLYSGGHRVAMSGKTFARLDAAPPERASRRWQPPVTPTKTYHVDAREGDDARDGLTPATAWRTLAHARGLALGAGERLLLRRGSVFREPLVITAKGAPGNWAEIGAYGEGRRPCIDRRRDYNAACAKIDGASCLVVRDLVVCNAGAGLLVSCVRPNEGDVVIEWCLAHHIEGGYRKNAHGIPEWWDAPGPIDGGRTRGIELRGPRVMLRDCETYQCSSGWVVSGTDAVATRLLCHDNFSHNTSPHPYNLASRAWMTDCVFDASGWHASAGTMGVMLANNVGLVIRGCHFLNQPDSGSPDQGGIDFEAGGDNCLVENCTFRNNSGAAIEVLGLRSPQAHNVVIRGCKFDHNNRQLKNGPAEIQVWGCGTTPPEVACASGLIASNGYSLVPGVPFYVNETAETNAWTFAGNRAFDFTEDLDAAFPYADPPHPVASEEIWTDEPTACVAVRGVEGAAVRWEALEGPFGVRFANPGAARTRVTLPGEGDYRLHVTADCGALWGAARTAVHVLPRGSRVYKAWNFARNLDTEGWRVEEAGTSYQSIKAKNPFWNTESFPVRMVCGDAFVIAVKASGMASIVTADETELGVEASASRANAVRLRLQNHTDSRQMRLFWQTPASPRWTKEHSAAFNVRPLDVEDTVYVVPLPRVGSLKQLKLAFSADGRPITGTIRIDSLALAKLPSSVILPLR